LNLTKLCAALLAVAGTGFVVLHLGSVPWDVWRGTDVSSGEMCAALYTCTGVLMIVGAAIWISVADILHLLETWGVEMDEADDRMNEWRGK